MSQLRLVKPNSVFKNVLRRTNVRMFSSIPTFPFILIDYLINFERHPSDDGRVAKCYHDILNDCKQKGIFISDIDLRFEVCDAMTLGIPRGGSVDYGRWRRTDDEGEDFQRISIDYEPSDPELKNVELSLPPLPSGFKIHNIAMSSLPVQDRDWVVAVKSSGSRVSLCRPYGNSTWINIEAMPESISPFSSIMFSKKDKRFYVPSPGGKRLCSLDLHFKEEDKPKFLNIEYDQLPKSVVGELEGVSSCSRADHLVESPTGDLFLVKWYGDDWNQHSNGSSLTHKTKQFMVFRAEEGGFRVDKNMIYTEDIGDLCIFLGYDEALCVPASSSAGLRPNCIYFVGYSFGFYDLTNKTCTTFFKGNNINNRELLRDDEFPYWPLPLPLN